ncbi:MAG: enoyl-CoA hydratase/isomerase family protein [Planctomycetes bacterium]|nr:enoyl-CoA hydratase/isomerase family protein [Planctomycetota bacterium]
MSKPAIGALQLDFLPDGVARLTFDQPGSKANTLGQVVFAELENALKNLESRKDLRGLIFGSAKPGMFIAGADLKELASPNITAEQTRQLVQRGLDIFGRFENLPYPTVVLIDGACMGGGLELALTFDYRLAGSHPKVEIGLPEVKIGLIPGWGGTQRLSRVIGPAPAIELICAGDSVNAQKSRELGLCWDAVPSDQLETEAVRLISWSRESGDWKLQRLRKRQPVGLSDDQLSFAFRVARGAVEAKTKGQFPAPLAALDAIAKGCNLPLKDGLRIETERFVPLVGSPISRNLIALFFMTQQLQKDTGVADTKIQPRSVQQVGVIGAGIMGASIAGAHIRRGVPTLLLDVSREALDKGLAAITKVHAGRVEAGKLGQADLLKAMSLLTTTTNLALMADRDVVIEAVVENEQLKKDLYGELQKHLHADAILASNTSTISISRMAESVKNPANFAGMHFFNPVDRMQLVEVIRGDKTNDVTVAMLVALAKRIGKSPIVVRDCPGFLVNRILFQYLNEAMVMLEEGADARALDKAATTFGMPMGPITLSDVVGLDTCLYAGQVVNTAFAERAASTGILDELVEAGRMGQKSGAGFYSYAKGSRGVDDPALKAFLDRCGKGQRTHSQEEITDRLFLPMLVEASLVLAEGIVREPADVDMGLILGIGFPTFRGGLLRWADAIGLDKVLASLAKYERLGPRFRPTEQMRRFAAEKKGFYQ